MKATKEQQQYIDAYIAAHPIGTDSQGTRVTKVEQVGDTNAISVWLVPPACPDEISVECGAGDKP
jgi:hypothetical protein